MIRGTCCETTKLGGLNARRLAAAFVRANHAAEIWPLTGAHLAFSRIVLAESDAYQKGVANRHANPKAPFAEEAKSKPGRRL